MIHIKGSLYIYIYIFPVSRSIMGTLLYVVQVVLVEFLGNFADTVKLSWKYWIVSVVIGLVR